MAGITGALTSALVSKLRAQTSGPAKQGLILELTGPTTEVFQAVDELRVGEPVV